MAPRGHIHEVGGKYCLFCDLGDVLKSSPVELSKWVDMSFKSMKARIGPDIESPQKERPIPERT
jgi:hypothetical protein